jgi:deazaflavin-dependent oxidoreductase (nitroreductase family)
MLENKHINNDKEFINGWIPPLTAKPPSGLLGRLARLPVVFYRLGLGGLLGEQLILLNHIGRKTGAIHQAVVRVVSHEADSDTYYIASAWGFKSQWPRNLLAHPEIVVQIGRRKLTVDAHPLTPEQGAHILLVYRQHHPMAARQGWGPFWGINLAEADDAGLQAVVRDKVPMFRMVVQSQIRNADEK